MAERIGQGGRRGWSVWRIAGWSFAALLLLLPLIAMQFTDVDWDETDFIVMGAMIGSVGFGIEFLVRQSDSIAYRLGAVIALLTVFLTLWVNLAVGMIGSEDNAYNLLFGGVLVLALIGSILARFRPEGMAGALVATAIVQAAISAYGLSADVRGGIFSLCFAAPWLLAAALFWGAAREQSPVNAAR